MFWRFKNLGQGKDNLGRTFEEAHKEHAQWCMDTLRANKPDDEETLGYMFSNSPTAVTMPDEYKEYFAGDAVFNAYAEIKSNLDDFKKYYTAEDLACINSWWKK